MHASRINLRHIWSAVIAADNRRIFSQFDIAAVSNQRIHGESIAVKITTKLLSIMNHTEITTQVATYILKNIMGVRLVITKLL